MRNPPARPQTLASLILIGLFSLGLQAPVHAHAADTKPDAKPEAKADAKSDIELPPLSEDKKVHQSITLNGKVLN